MAPLISLDLVPKKMKGPNYWDLRTIEETKGKREETVFYFTGKGHAAVSRPGAWLSFDSAVNLLKKHFSFEGLCFIIMVDLGITSVDYEDSITEEENEIWKSLPGVEMECSLK